MLALATRDDRDYDALYGWFHGHSDVPAMTTPRPDPAHRHRPRPVSHRGRHRSWRHGRRLPRRAHELDRKVALKLLPATIADDEDFRARFLRESKLAAAIDHPNIIPIYDAGEIDGTLYLAMRYVEGVDLASRLRAGPLEPPGRLDPGPGRRRPGCRARRGLVHRDVKPANVLIAPAGRAIGTTTST